MPAREYQCRVTETKWLTPSVLHLRFEPNRRIPFEAGQFTSLIVPKDFVKNAEPKIVMPTEPKRIRRIYSFACSPENGYELCVKMTGGPGPRFLASLKAGDAFVLTAPYGDFLYESKPGRGVCFVSTGTGIAPFRGMIQSAAFQEHPPTHALSLFGARDEQEILYEAEFHELGVETVFALSRPEPSWRGFVGRVTDYLRQLPPVFPWHTTNFYLCGNGSMVEEVKQILHSRGVKAEAIHGEVYFSDRRSDERPGLTETLADRMRKLG